MDDNLLSALKKSWIREEELSNKSVCQKESCMTKASSHEHIICLPAILTSQQEECSRPQEEEDIMDIPLDDPEANRAAAKIQAGFRGHMTRKKMKPEDKAEGEEVSSTGDVLNGNEGDTGQLCRTKG